VARGARRATRDAWWVAVAVVVAGPARLGHAASKSLGRKALSAPTGRG
jgi:hypothetical protein